MQDTIGEGFQDHGHYVIRCTLSKAAILSFESVYASIKSKHTVEPTTDLTAERGGGNYSKAWVSLTVTLPLGVKEHDPKGNKSSDSHGTWDEC